MAELSITDQFVFLALAAAPDGWRLDGDGRAIAPAGTSAAAVTSPSSRRSTSCAPPAW